MGGGVSGLATAYFLAKKGFRPTLIEKSTRLGGLIKTDLIDGCQLEAGPDSFISSKPAVAELAAELGFSNQIIGSNDASRRVFIERAGSLVPLPKGMVMMVPGDLRAALRSSLFSPGTKVGFFRELLKSPRRRDTDLSVKELVLDHFGPEMLTRVTEPLLAGVYGGDSASLSVTSVLPRFLDYEREYGSLIRGVQHEPASPRNGSLFQSFAGGMQTIVDALAREVAALTDLRTAEVTSVAQTATGWDVWIGDDPIAADHVVLACPAYINSRLLKRSAPRVAQGLAEIPYSSAVLVTLVYDREQFAHPLNGFGFLVPRTERGTIAAATWVSTKFPSRTPANRVAVRGFIVGDQAKTLMDAPDSQLTELMGDDLRRLMNVQAVPLFTTLYRWPESMPQYTVGHRERQARLREELALLPGLHLCGNAYDGVGIPDCIRLARQTAALIPQIHRN